ncbi:MAG: LCP family protein [Firmicutes bacterium]|nr:LCP family protein [Bacillota bacterium]
MKLAGAGDDPDDHSTVIADEKLEQSSYRSLTGEEEARLAAEKAEAERIAAEKAAAEKAAAKRKAEEQAKAEEAARQAAIKKAREKEAERIAALEQAKAEDAARDAAFRKEASEQKAARPTDSAAARKAPAGNTAEKPSAKSGKTAAAGAAASAAAKKVSAGSAGAKASTGSGRPATGTGKPAAGSGKSAPANGKPAPAAGKPAAKSRKPAPDSSADTAKSGKPAPAAGNPAAKSRKPAAAAAADTAKAKKTAAPDSKPVKPKKDRSPGKIISIVHLVLSVLTVLLLLIANVLPIPLLLIVTAGLAAIWFLTRLFRTENAGRFRRLLGAALSIFMCFVLVLSSAMLLRLNVTLKSITGVNSQIATFGVYALVDDSAETIKDVKDDTFGVLEAQSRAMTDDAIGQINKEVGRTINTANYADASALANGLMNGECRTIIMNESFMDVITDTDGYGDFESKTKEIASYTCTSILESRLSQSHSPDVITMYITGIDTFGDISTTSRSDVNIIAVANTKTRQVLLVSTPRDYYVPLSISNGIPDKLTHAGIYGVNVSMDTLGMLYGIDMDYYFRINFDGFKEVIDALDGVTVWSDNEFDAGGNHYVQGYNTLNGEQALAFARERHSFASGDRQRGKNQMAVIQAVIQKLQTPAILNNYNDLLKGLEGSFETDLPSTRITGLVKQQLAKPGSWNVVQYSVDGTGDMNTTFSMNQRLYVMVPDQSTVDTAKRMIEMVDNGAVITSQQ